MNGSFPLLTVLPVLALVSCGQMTPADYRTSEMTQRQAYPNLRSVYHNGQTPGQIRESIKKAELGPMLSDTTRDRPSTGWDARSWELLYEQAHQTNVARVDRFSFGGMRGFAAVVHFHRVYYDSKGRSIGWYATHD